VSARGFLLGTTLLLAALALAAAPGRRALGPAPVAATPTRVDTAAADTAGAAARGAVSVSVHYGTFRPTAGASCTHCWTPRLPPGAQALRPRVTGGALHVRVTPRWAVLLGAEAGGRQTASVSRVRPAGVTADVRQWTAFDSPPCSTPARSGRRCAGAARARGAPDRARSRSARGSGARATGCAGRRLRRRRPAPRFGDEFRSDGTGAIRFARRRVEVPVRRWLGRAGHRAPPGRLRPDARRLRQLRPPGPRRDALDVGLHLRPGGARVRHAGERAGGRAAYRSAARSRPPAGSAS
jgi:hypothetical protein